ncbi:MAG: hypothetical protein KA297_08375 [Kofleriaceae bacterium]|nr:hypothetical protein [Kofleriaceae bacterium]
MRLPEVARGVGLRDRALYGFVRVVSGHPVPDVVRTLRYRAAFFGAPFNDYLQQVMRGPSHWSVGERELMAAWVSKKNECEF